MERSACSIPKRQVIETTEQLSTNDLEFSPQTDRLVPDQAFSFGRRILIPVARLNRISQGDVDEIEAIIKLVNFVRSAAAQEFRDCDVDRARGC